MSGVSSIPHLTPLEFEAACKELSDLFAARRHRQIDWLSVELVQCGHGKYLKITKQLGTSASIGKIPEPEEEDVEEEDEAVLSIDTSQSVVVEYDITLSPVYRVPVLYFRIKDPSFRYPPNMTTLYRHLIAGQFKSQAEHAGVMGGITVRDHPYTGTPVYFIHPCQTATVLQASIDSDRISPYMYLVLWISAICSAVGLNIPIDLVADRNPISTPLP